jgi:hypothetical protein
MCPNLSGNYCIAGLQRERTLLYKVRSGRWLELHCYISDRLCRTMSFYSHLQQARMKQGGREWQALVPNFQSREASCLQKMYLLDSPQAMEGLSIWLLFVAILRLFSVYLGLLKPSLLQIGLFSRIQCEHILSSEVCKRVLKVILPPRHCIYINSHGGAA